MVNCMAGDTQLINDSLYENFSNVTTYYDDSFEKTAYFLQCLSTSDIQESFIGRNQEYSLKSFQYLPSAMFKLYCANMRTKKGIEYPKYFR